MTGAMRVRPQRRHDSKRGSMPRAIAPDGCLHLLCFIVGRVVYMAIALPSGAAVAAVAAGVVAIPDSRGRSQMPAAPARARRQRLAAPSAHLRRGYGRMTRTGGRLM